MKWQRTGNLEDKIASIMITNLDKFKSQISTIMGDKSISYSGIVISNNDNIADGSKMEKRCYNKGGFKFLYKSYMDDDVNSQSFPIKEFKTMIEKIAKIYHLSIVGKKTTEVYLDSCWGVCQRDGDYGAMHNHTSPVDHEGVLYSGMIYLKVPDSISPTTFPDGCLHIVTKAGVTYLPPIENCIVFWPAELIHGIHPFRGNGDRLGIAFNVVMKTGE